MIQKLTWFILLSVMMTLSPRSARAFDVRELVHRADYVLRGQTTAAVLRMDTHKSTYDRNFSMVYWEDRRDRHNRDLVKILGPALWRGHGTLKADGRMTVYDPSADRLTVLSNSMLGDSWMGSHFTNDDLVRETDLARDYAARELRAWDGKTAAGAPAQYHLIELTATPGAAVVWPKIQLELYAVGNVVIPTKQYYFLRASETSPTRTMSYDNVRDLGGRTVPTVLTLTLPSKPGEYTKLTYETLRFDAPIPGGKFTEQSLRQ